MMRQHNSSVQRAAAVVPFACDIGFNLARRPIVGNRLVGCRQALAAWATSHVLVITKKVFTPSSYLPPFVRLGGKHKLLN